MKSEYWTVTVSEEPVKDPVGGIEDLDRPVSRFQYAKLENAVKCFIEYCQSLDVGAVQLWEGNYEIGKLFL